MILYILKWYVCLTLYLTVHLTYISTYLQLKFILYEFIITIAIPMLPIDTIC